MRTRQTFWVAFVLVMFLHGFAANPVIHADSPRVDSKLVSKLTGRIERVRQNALAQLSSDSRRIGPALPSLVQAARVEAEELPHDQIARPSTIKLIYLIGTIDDDDAESLLIELLDASHFGIAMVAADALGRNKFHGAIEFLKRQVDRPEFETNYGFRFNLVRSLAQMQHIDAVEFLSQLEPRLTGQLRFEVKKLLAEVTVDHFQGDQTLFEQWSASRQPEVVIQQASFEDESLARLRLSRKHEYYGIEIQSRRTMFVIDHSGSMDKYWGGISRLQRAKIELVRAIEALPYDAEFAILFFETGVRLWREHLVQATEANKREAIAFVNRLGVGDRTNTYGALRRVLEFDQQLESVFILTDGQPTIGDVVAPRAIITDILHRNRFRHLNINTIGIAVSGSTEQFLMSLAEETAGEYRAAE